MRKIAINKPCVVYQHGMDEKEISSMLTKIAKRA